LRAKASQVGCLWLSFSVRIVNDREASGEGMKHGFGQRPTRQAAGRKHMTAVVKRYFEAFNEGDLPAMLECLAEDVEHHVNEGGIRHGKGAFAEFCAHMHRCYREKLTDLVIFTAPDDSRAAAEYVVNGTYVETDDGLPEAHGQSYKLPAGSFFDLKDGKITRVTTRYNLRDWIDQVSA
jgi:steroid delta-isomerase-like uncharacterized protein